MDQAEFYGNQAFLQRSVSMNGLLTKGPDIGGTATGEIDLCDFYSEKHNANK